MRRSSGTLCSPEHMRRPQLIRCLIFLVILPFVAPATHRLAIIGGPTDSLDAHAAVGVRAAVQHVNNRDWAAAGEKASALPDGFALEIIEHPAGSSSREAIAAVQGAVASGAVAILGGFSPWALPSAAFESAMQIPQVSFGSADAQLSDKELYPYFSRVLPAEPSGANAVVRTVRHFGWRGITVLHDDSSAARQRAQLLETAGGSSASITSCQYVPGDMASAARAMGCAAQAAWQPIVPLSGSPGADWPVLLQAAERAGILSRHLWICWCSATSCGLSPTAQDPQDFPQHFLWISQSSAEAAPPPVSLPSGPSPVPQGQSAPRDGVIKPEDRAALAYDATWSLALALAHLETEMSASNASLAFSADQLVGSLRLLDFAGASGAVRFTAQGDRAPGTVWHSLSALDSSGELRTSKNLNWDSELGPLENMTLPDTFSAMPPTGCAIGSLYHPQLSRCAYALALMFPDTVEQAAAAVAAFLAIQHVNFQNTSLVPDIASVRSSVWLEPKLVTREDPAYGWLLDSTRADSAGVEASVPFAGVVGLENEEMILGVEKVLRAQDGAVISHAASSPVLSGLPSFSRVVPSSSQLAAVIAAVVLSPAFAWEKVGVLVGANHEGTAFLHSLQAEVQEQAAMRNQTAPVILGMPLSPETTAFAIESLTEGAGVTNFVFGAQSMDAQSVISFASAVNQLGLDDSKYRFITAVEGSLRPDGSLLYQPNVSNDTEKLPAELGLLRQGMVRLRVSPQPEASGQYTVDQQTLSGLLLPDGLLAAASRTDAQGSLTLGMPALRAYDAVVAMALGISASGETGGSLVAAIRQADFEGLSGPVSFHREPQTVAAAGGAAAGDLNMQPVVTHLDFFDAVLDQWTHAGHVTSSPGGHMEVTMVKEVEWTSSSHPDTAQCRAGWYFDFESLECEQCSPGTFSILEGATECMPCSPGHRCNAYGCTSCSLCELGRWQDGFMAQECSPCPGNSTTASLGMKTVEECRCQPGYYRRDGQPGKECYPCPEGGICLGGSTLPFPQQGYWGDWSMIDEDVPDGQEAAAEIHWLAFHRCPSDFHCTNSCNGTNSSFVEGLESAAFSGHVVASNSDVICRASQDSLCMAEPNEAYTGIQCMKCDTGFFALGGRCFKCQSPKALFVIGCILCIALLWYLINRIVAGRYEAVDLMLLYFQNASTVSMFALGWSQFLKDSIFSALTVVNFDVTFFSPTCLSTSTFQAWSYGHVHLLQLGLPLLVVLFAGFMYYANRAVLKLEREAVKLKTRFSSMGTGRSRRTSARDDDISQEAALLFGGVERVARPTLGARFRGVLVRFFGFATDESELASVRNSCIASVSNFGNVMYHTLTKQSLEVFQCQEFADGILRLTADPDVICWEGAHLYYTALSVAGIFVYTVAMPLTFWLILEYARVHNLFREETFLARFGWLYLRYEREWYFWELLLMARRGLLVVVLVLAQRLPSLQIVLGILIVVCSITLHFNAQPFISSALDTLETVGMISLIGLLCAGILFYEANLGALDPGWIVYVTAMAFVSIVACGLLVAVMVALDIRTSEALHRISRRMRRGLLHVLKTRSPSFAGSSQTGGKVMANLTGIFQPSSRRLDGRSSHLNDVKEEEADGGAPELRPRPGHSPRPRSTLPSKGSARRKNKVGMAGQKRVKKQQQWEEMSQVLMSEQLELHRTLDVHSLEKWLDSLKNEGLPITSVDKKAGIVERFKSIFTSRSTIVSLQTSNEEAPAALTAAELGTVRFWLVNHWMKKIMSDTSPVSYYSQQPYAVFFSNLVAENPYLIDHLLNASEADLSKAKGVINDLRAAQLSYTKEGHLCKLISEIDRGPLLAWLMVAKFGHIRVVRDVMNEVHLACSPGVPTPEEQAEAQQSWLRLKINRLLSMFPGPERFGYMPLRGDRLLRRQNASRFEVQDEGNCISQALKRVSSKAFSLCSSGSAPPRGGIRDDVDDELVTQLPDKPAPEPKRRSCSMSDLHKAGPIFRPATLPGAMDSANDGHGHTTLPPWLEQGQTWNPATEGAAVNGQPGLSGLETSGQHPQLQQCSKSVHSPNRLPPLESYLDSSVGSSDAGGRLLWQARVESGNLIPSAMSPLSPPELERMMPSSSRSSDGSPVEGSKAGVRVVRKTKPRKSSSAGSHSPLARTPQLSSLAKSLIGNQRSCFAVGGKHSMSLRSFKKVESSTRRRTMRTGAVRLLQFDKEIQHLSDFGSSMERWLLDLEESIAAGPHTGGRQSMRQIMAEQSSPMRGSIA